MKFAALLLFAVFVTAAITSCNPILPVDIAKLDSIKNDTSCNSIGYTTQANHFLFSTLGADNPFTIKQTVDKAGNVVFAGTLDNAIDFDPDSTGVLNVGGLFVQKTDTAGRLLWARQIRPKSGHEDYINNVKADANGNVYVAWSVFKKPGIDWYITKYSPSGELLWEKEEGDQYANNQAAYFCLSADANENLYAVYGSRISKYSATGSLLYKKDLIIASGELGFNDNLVEASSSGNVYIAGQFFGRKDLGSGTIEGDTLTWQKYIIKLDASGNHVWSKIYGQERYETDYNTPYRSRIWVDDAENTYVYTEANQSVEYEPYNFIKIDNAGNLTWRIYIERSSPEAVAVGPDAVYLLLRNSGSDYTFDIHKYSSGGTFIGSVSATEKSANFSTVPAQLGLDSHNNLFVVSKVWHKPDYPLYKMSYVVSRFKACTP